MSEMDDSASQIPGSLGSSRSGAVSSFDVRSCKQPLGPSHLIRRPVPPVDHGVIRIAAALIVEFLACPEDDDGDDEAARDQRKGVAREIRHLRVERLFLETSRDSQLDVRGRLRLRRILPQRALRFTRRTSQSARSPTESPWLCGSHWTLQDYVEVTCEPEPMHPVDAYSTNNIESRSRDRAVRRRKQRQPVHAPSLESGKAGHQGVSPTGRRRLVRVAEPTFQQNLVLPTPPLSRRRPTILVIAPHWVDVAHVMLVTTVELVRRPSCQETDSLPAARCSTRPFTVAFERG